MKTSTIFKGYLVAPDGELLGAYAACDACTEEGQVLPGHYRCLLPAPELDRAENDGRIVRRHSDNVWRYYLIVSSVAPGRKFRRFKA